LEVIEAKTIGTTATAQINMAVLRLLLIDQPRFMSVEDI